MGEKNPWVKKDIFFSFFILALVFYSVGSLKVYFHQKWFQTTNYLHFQSDTLILFSITKFLWYEKKWTGCCLTFQIISFSFKILPPQIFGIRTGITFIWKALAGRPGFNQPQRIVVVTIHSVRKTWKEMYGTFNKRRGYKSGRFSSIVDW